MATPAATPTTFTTSETTTIPSNASGKAAFNVKHCAVNKSIVTSCTLVERNAARVKAMVSITGGFFVYTNVRVLQRR